MQTFLLPTARRWGAELALWEETGGFGTLLMITHDWDDKQKWVRCMELLTQEVMPVLPSLEPGPPVSFDPVMIDILILWPINPDLQTSGGPI